MVLGLAAIYVHFGQLGWIQGMFYGVGAAVSAIIVRSAWKLIQKTLGKDYILWVLFGVLALTTVWTESEIVWLFVLAGFVALFIKAPPKLRMPATAPLLLPGFTSGLLGAASAGTVAWAFFYFLKAGAFVFGSGLAIVPFLYGGVVGKFHWLTERQFLDAVAVAMITPGPVVITSGFIGFLVAGPLGACAAALAVFLPPYLLVVFAAPYYRRFAQNRQVKAFVQGVTAAHCPHSLGYLCRSIGPQEGTRARSNSGRRHYWHRASLRDVRRLGGSGASESFLPAVQWVSGFPARHFAFLRRVRSNLTIDVDDDSLISAHLAATLLSAGFLAEGLKIVRDLLFPSGVRTSRPPE